jgi:hypothetical protein
MLLRLLQSRLIDILLIAAALYFLLPRLFNRRKANQGTTKTGPNVMVNQQDQATAKTDDKRGEYIDYEEIK